MLHPLVRTTALIAFAGACSLAAHADSHSTCRTNAPKHLSAGKDHRGAPHHSKNGLGSGDHHHNNNGGKIVWGSPSHSGTVTFSDTGSCASPAPDHSKPSPDIFEPSPLKTVCPPEAGWLIPVIDHSPSSGDHHHRNNNGSQDKPSEDGGLQLCGSHSGSGENDHHHRSNGSQDSQGSEDDDLNLCHTGGHPGSGGGSPTGQGQPAPVPEPSSLTAISFGLLGLGALMLRAKRKPIA